MPLLRRLGRRQTALSSICRTNQIMLGKTVALLSMIRSRPDRALPQAHGHRPDDRALSDDGRSEQGRRQKDAAITNMSLKDWRAVLDINLTGQFLCVREANPPLSAQGPTSVSRPTGKVIWMSSVHELIPWAGHVNYAASKGGVMQMMKSVAQEVADKKIRVNGIAPARSRPISTSRSGAYRRPSGSS